MTLGVVLSPCLKCRSSGFRPSEGRPRWAEAQRVDTSERLKILAGDLDV